MAETPMGDKGELRRIENELNEANVPEDVFIGTNSVADRVTWLITRNKLNQQNSRSRFKAMNELADLVEIALVPNGLNEDWRVKADEALVLAGRRQS
jgi:hypothetical protein